jgi:hypothetical protein
MENKIAESEIQENQAIALTDVQMKLYQEAQDELDKFNKEITTKKYLVDLNKEEIKMLREFIEKDAKWKFMESLGIGEVSKELASSVDKTGKAFIPANAIEAIYYYLSKVEGVGKKVDSAAIKDVETYLKFLKSLNVAKNAISIDTEKQKELEYVLVCRAEGLSPEDPEIK